MRELETTRLQLRKLSPIAGHGFMLPVGDWVLRHKLGHNTGGADYSVFITVVFVISCVETRPQLYHIISSVTTLSLSLLYRHQIELHYFSLLECWDWEAGRSDGLEKHLSTEIRYLSQSRWGLSSHLLFLQWMLRERKRESVRALDVNRDKWYILTALQANAGTMEGQTCKWIY